MQHTCTTFITNCFVCNVLKQAWPQIVIKQVRKENKGKKTGQRQYKKESKRAGIFVGIAQLAASPPAGAKGNKQRRCTKELTKHQSGKRVGQLGQGNKLPLTSKSGEPTSESTGAVDRCPCSMSASTLKHCGRGGQEERPRTREVGVTIVNDTCQWWPTKISKNKSADAVSDSDHRERHLSTVQPRGAAQRVPQQSTMVHTTGSITMVK
eukprot:scaffold34658_cov19-Tisochrysis_lutea.AAC.1